MEDLKELYEKKKYTALEKACQKAESAGSADFTVYLYHACTQMARSNFSRFTAAQGISLFQKARELSQGQTAAQKQLYELFAEAVLQAVARYESTFSSVSMTNEIVEAYRNSMQQAADALCETVSLGEVLELSDADAGKDVLSLKKMAVHCMVELCQVRKYEVDMGKAISKRTNNAPENIRVTYGEKYDRLVQEIQAVDAGYEPEPIQREHVAAEEANACQLKLPPEGEAAGTTAAADPQAQTAGAAKGTDAAGQKHPDAADPGTASKGFLGWLKGLFS